MGDGSIQALSKRADAANLFFLITKNNADPFYFPWWWLMKNGIYSVTCLKRAAVLAKGAAAFFWQVPSELVPARARPLPACRACRGGESGWPANVASASAQDPSLLVRAVNQAGQLTSRPRPRETPSHARQGGESGLPANTRVRSSSETPSLLVRAVNQACQLTPASAAIRDPSLLVRAVNQASQLTPASAAIRDPSPTPQAGAPARAVNQAGQLTPASALSETPPCLSGR